MNILVTGATGFVGTRLVEILLNNNITIIAVVRNQSDFLPKRVKQFDVGSLSSSTDYSSALKDVDVVIHLAARVHMMNDAAGDPLTEFRKVNTTGTLNLARQAAQAGVSRFIFISSIGVNGNNNKQVFTELEQPDPQESYAISKYEAELELLALTKEFEIEIVIIRPPLVYGPNAPGNFASLMKWIDKGIPLPFGAIHNQRSLVALDNLVSFIIHCIDHPKAANEVFLISDGEDVSTTQLLQKVAKASGKKSLLLPVPIGLMTMIAKVIGKGDMANRLFGSLQVDSSKARDLLGWQPVITMDEQLKKTADIYLNEKSL